MNGELLLRKQMNEELEKGKTKNSSYSLRALARKLDLSPSALSEMLRGKRSITFKSAKNIVDRLMLDPTIAKRIFEGYAVEKGQHSNGIPSVSQREFVQFNMDHFHLLSDWCCFAIISLSETEDFQSDPKWMSQRLGVSVRHVKAAIQRMLRLEVLQINENAVLSTTGVQYRTSTDVANPSIRKMHEQNLELARRSLERDSVHKRDFTTMTMAIDPVKLPEAKKRITEFRRGLCEFLEEGPKKEVFRICIQLFPLTKEQEQ